jgi:hypothetical protein
MLLPHVAHLKTLTRKKAKAFNQAIADALLRELNPNKPKDVKIMQKIYKQQEAAQNVRLVPKPKDPCPPACSPNIYPDDDARNSSF